MKKYEPKDFQEIEVMEHIRHRPKMYVGSLDTAGYEFMLAEARKIGDIVELKKEGVITWMLDMPLPVEIHPKVPAMTLMEIHFTVIGAGVLQDKTGINSTCILPVLNALCESLIVETVHPDKTYRMSFSKGRVVEPFSSRPTLPSDTKNVSSLSFVLDPTIWGT